MIQQRGSVIQKTNPYLTYAASAWTANPSDQSWMSLERVQSSALRTITGSQWSINNQVIRNSAKIPTIKTLISQATKYLIETLKSSYHEHLSNIYNRTISTKRNSQKKTAQHYLNQPTKQKKKNNSQNNPSHLFTHPGRSHRCSKQR